MAESHSTSCSVLVQCLALLAGLLRRCVLRNEKSVSTECQSNQYTQRTAGAADGARVPRRCPRKLPLGSTDIISAFHWSMCGTVYRPGAMLKGSQWGWKGSVRCACDPPLPTIISAFH